MGKKSGKEWKSKYLEKKSQELAAYNLKNIEIKNFVKYFLKKNELILKDFKILFCKSAIKIFISFYTSKDSIPIINEINTNQGYKLKKFNLYKSNKTNKSSKLINILINSKKKFK